MAAQRLPSGRVGPAKLLGGTALAAVLLGASVALAQQTTERIVDGTTVQDRGQLDSNERRSPSARDRTPLGEGQSNFLKSTGELSEDEQELLRELYNEGATIDRLDDEEYGRPDAEETPETPSFDLFSGPERSPTSTSLSSGSNRPAAAAPSALPEARPAPSDQAGNQRALIPDPDFAEPTRAEPVSRLPGTENRFSSFANPPLSAGVTGEILSPNSLLQANDPARAIQRIVRGPRDDRPFDGIGIRAGTTTIYPELYQGAGYSTNIDSEPGGEGGAFSETELNIRAITDWPRNEAEVNAQLTYRKDFGGAETANPSASIDGRLGLEFGPFTTASLRGALAYRQDDEIDIGFGLPGGTPEVLTGSLAAEVSHEIARNTITGGVVLSREQYVSLPEGLPDPGYTTATARLRSSYEISPALSPFAEISLGRRLYDETLAANGDATIPAGRLGLALDIAEKIRGEVALGYAMSLPEEGDRTGAATIDANLIWSPRRGTDVVLEARTIFEPDGAGGSSANYEASLGLLHRINNRLDLNAALRADFEKDDAVAETPIGLAAEVGFTYWINRSLSLTGLYEHERQYEIDRADDWSANTVSLGVRLQR